MARTLRRTGRDGKEDYTITGVRSWANREARWARKQTNRKARNRTREILATTVDHDAMVDPRPVSTSGWITH